MQRIVLILIIIVLVAAIGWGVYFLMSRTGGAPSTTNQGSGNSKQFDIQGMKVEILKEGSGQAVKVGDSATVHYTGTLENGTKFDSSVDRNAPFTFAVGEGRVIKGWDLGVEGMKVGEKRKLTIPSDLAYGDTGFLSIPPKATLIFEVELLRIN